ncbi:methyltransferase family protein [Haloactinospora alba]|uniref:Methyltransferase family protein n=1 Tax=Haloactinospora alba TaxID=405555 RepID=A0A543NFG0_9ACTN|nr:class I SAM-dependent methyltransferase [Haloactinospora alba]TQN30490.1 methyltransferase family protein [Haloactinospora alba]
MDGEIPERYGSWIFTQSHSDEADRLRAIAATYNRFSRGQIRTLGLGEDPRCLDVGAGPGSIAAWLATEFPRGEIVAADRDASMLVPLADSCSNLEAVETDVSDDTALHGMERFDLVHARFVLMHLRDRLRVLDTLGELVSPGGWLLLGDSIDLTTEELSHTAYGKTMNAMWEVLHANIGTDISWVSSTPSLLRSRGFVDIGSEAYLPSADHRPPVSRFWKLTWQQLRDRLITSGRVDAATVERALAQLDDPDFTAVSPGMLNTRGRATRG